MQTLEKYTWLKKINDALVKSDAIPLMRSFAPFDFTKLSVILKKKFSLENFDIKPHETKWLTADEIKLGFAENVNYLSFNFSPLEGNVFLLIDLEDISKITNELLSDNNKMKFTSTILQESYFRFLALETLASLNDLNLFQDLSAKIVETQEPSSEEALCIDLILKINSTNAFIRIAICKKLRSAWEEYFINNPPLKALEISKNLSLVLTAQLGYVKLSYASLKKLKTGDFVILDSIDYDAANNKGTVILKLGETSLFLAKIKEKKLKIVDFANYEETPNMEEKQNNEELFAEAQNEALPTAKIENMPITIIVEAGRFKMNLEKIINMQPGNIIDLALHPETYVNLTVNGQKIGSGELVNLGETLGVRIVEMG